MNAADECWVPINEVSEYLEAWEEHPERAMYSDVSEFMPSIPLWSWPSTNLK